MATLLTGPTCWHGYPAGRAYPLAGPPYWQATLLAWPPCWQGHPASRATYWQASLSPSSALITTFDDRNLALQVATGPVVGHDLPTGGGLLHSPLSTGGLSGRNLWIISGRARCTVGGRTRCAVGGRTRWAVSGGGWWALRVEGSVG